MEERKLYGWERRSTRKRHIVQHAMYFDDVSLRELIRENPPFKKNNIKWFHEVPLISH